MGGDSSAPWSHPRHPAQALHLFTREFPGAPPREITEVDGTETDPPEAANGVLHRSHEAPNLALSPFAEHERDDGSPIVVRTKELDLFGSGGPVVELDPGLEPAKRARRRGALDLRAVLPFDLR